MNSFNRNLRFFLSLAVTTSLLFFCSSCSFSKERVKLTLKQAVKKVNFYKDADIKAPVHRVLLMPVMNLSRQKLTEDDFYREIVLMFSKYNYFELLTAERYPQEIMKIITDFYRDKKERTPSALNDIKQFCEENKIDAFIFPEIVLYRAYKPLVIGYRHNMVRLPGGELLWSVDDVFKMNDPNVDVLAKNWYYKNCPDEVNPSLKGNIMDISITNFTAFVLELIGQTWQ